jgi:hypothetical protein
MGDESSPELWYEVFQLASTIIFKDEEDSLVWQFTSMEFIEFNLYIK